MRQNAVEGSITTNIHALDNDVPSAKHYIICLNTLLKRLYPLDKMEWLEQSIVMRVYLTGKYPPTQTAEGGKHLRRVSDGFLPPKLPLIWQKSERMSPRHYPVNLCAQCRWYVPWRMNGLTSVAMENLRYIQEFEEALSWSLLAQHDLLQQSNANDTKF